MREYYIFLRQLIRRNLVTTVLFEIAFLVILSLGMMMVGPSKKSANVASLVKATNSLTRNIAASTGVVSANPQTSQGQPGSTNQASATSTATGNKTTSSTVKPGNTAKSTSSTPNQPVSTQSNGPKLILSAYQITMTNLDTPTGQHPQFTVTSNDGPITCPLITGYQRAVALENTGSCGASAASHFYRNSWTFTLSRLSEENGGSDEMDLTSLTQDGHTVTAHLDLYLQWIPIFTATAGNLDEVQNGNNTTTLTIHVILHPGAGFDGTKLHMCVIQYTNYCSLPTAINDFTYSGNNDVTLTETVATGAHGTLRVYVDSFNAYGSYYLQYTY
jgi:hypothetical protein